MPTHLGPHPATHCVQQLQQITSCCDRSASAAGQGDTGCASTGAHHMAAEEVVAAFATKLFIRSEAEARRPVVLLSGERTNVYGVLEKHFRWVDVGGRARRAMQQSCVGGRAVRAPQRCCTAC